MTANLTRTASAARFTLDIRQYGRFRALLKGTIFAAAVATAGQAGASDTTYYGPSSVVEGWLSIDPAEFQPNRADSAGQLIAVMLEPFLETTEGPNQRVKMDIWPNGDTFRAAALATGIGDDSVTSIEQVIAVAPDGEGGWKVTEVFKRWVCARGDNAGAWTDKPCL